MHLVGLLFHMNYDARNHELKIHRNSTSDQAYGHFCQYPFATNRTTVWWLCQPLTASFNKRQRITTALQTLLYLHLSHSISGPNMQKALQFLTVRPPTRRNTAKRKTTVSGTPKCRGDFTDYGTLMLKFWLTLIVLMWRIG